MVQITLQALLKFLKEEYSLSMAIMLTSGKNLGITDVNHFFMVEMIY